ncbi:MAG: peptidoglycan editing factor PgeF [Lachnospiraceae bacterium]|nr:peptidoglycan editing factor PgeF [Lachnospiraceae bacterium]
MIIHGESDPPFLTFPGLERTGLVTHAFSTRLGGVSRGCFSSLNFGWGTSDEKDNIRENFRRMAVSLGTVPERMVTTQQTHTTNLRVVTEEDAGKGTVRARDYSDVDGLITDRRGLMLVTYFADCVPLYFLDPVKKVIALSHSGWKGTAAGMGEVTVRRMGEEFGCDPADILAAIGPSICRDCYEVDKAVYDGFKGSFSEIELGRIFAPGRPGHFQLDLWLANRLILERAGIRPEHIETACLCTACHSEILFSHRATGGRRGLMCAFLALNN